MTATELPDLQSQRPGVALGLDRVGITGVRAPMGSIIRIRDGLILQDPLISVFVNLPRDQRGIHTSRSYEALYEVIEEARGSKSRLEEVAERVARLLLLKHDYATKSHVRIIGNVLREVKAPKTSKSSFERIRAMVGASGRNEDGNINVSLSLGTEVWGVTACPCAQKVISTLLNNHQNGSYTVTHMQRTLFRASLSPIESNSVDLLEFADVVKSGMSAPLFQLLKRIDEAYVVLRAVENPLFVEDTVRIIAHNVATRFTELPDSTTLQVRVRSIESLHEYNFEAELRSTLGEVRALKRGDR
ncbi:MAG: GTP cyclohydrolase MptA [Aigarchaeota archaeon]|nr:GTP cyclohydrolase MptA [Aigarchaeota archaeon]MDW8093152.1 GTP cyclohydrolase MptA [Nitrososphaerota archaeon]